ncbi:MAG: hypothetical protein C5B60_09265 [Chloroflexi bacterium]|nr:MAG: hypothetical protein C5B60_09265 [Chloroflexota bacterium]
MTKSTATLQPNKKPWHADADPHNRDWLRTRTWDQLPEDVVSLRHFLAFLGMSGEQFRKTPVYLAHVTSRPWLREL